MKNRFLNVICLCFILFSGAFFVSCKDTSTPRNKVEDIVLPSSFLSLDIFQGDEVDLSEYFVTIKNTVNKDQGFAMSQLLSVLDTTKIGEHKFTLSYGSFSKEFKYEVKAILPLDAMFSGEVEYYLHEGAEFGDKKFTVLYTNGDEKLLSLQNAEIDFSAMPKNIGNYTLNATYEEISFSVKINVMTREVVKDMEYAFKDLVGIFEDSTQNYFTRYDGERFVIYTKTDGKIEERSRINVKASEVENEFTGKVQVNGKLVSCKIYLTKDGIVAEEIKTNE